MYSLFMHRSQGFYDFLMMNLCMNINHLAIPKTWLGIHTIKHDKHLKGKRMPLISPLINFPFFFYRFVQGYEKQRLIFMHKFLENFAMTRWFQGQCTHHNLSRRTYKASSKEIFKQKRERIYKLSQGKGGMSPTFSQLP